MGWRLAGAASFASLLFFGGCSSLEGLSGGDPDAGLVTDGSATSEGAAANDGASDGSTGDASDATTVVDGGPPICTDASANVVFCTDFEEASPIAKWDNAPGQIKGGNGQISIVAGAGIGGS